MVNGFLNYQGILHYHIFMFYKRTPLALKHKRMSCELKLLHTSWYFYWLGFFRKEHTLHDAHLSYSNI